ncbi:hypothetical protein HWQ46_16965 [Shewanella sp. D64]|uniref:hypothetical protein n=1 Tax=unclassified Shewanella TaxID=196818 RepID=UPI0022BA13CA|nr:MULTISPECIES: hypothetical protein [unclassified Shewanella]MEC4727239.1 hypothetical protein [Shewanella sp. D64]MEC4739394.1 hypothetical protein [Shewanella sp. E94]WBJ96723.1 hypothetical protein HWQ47_06300 [Shewanella sp. MTB7]
MTNEILAVEQPACNSAFIPTIKWEFDLTNQQHLDMRRLMADIYQRNTASLNKCNNRSDYYSGMAYGLSRVSLQVLRDSTLHVLCLDLFEAVALQELLHLELRN